MAFSDAGQFVGCHCCLIPSSCSSPLFECRSHDTFKDIFLVTRPAGPPIPRSVLSVDLFCPAFVVVVHESNRILGNTFEIQSNKVKAKKAKADTPRKAPGSVPENSATVHPNLEDVLCGMFDIELRDLLADP